MMDFTNQDDIEWYVSESTTSDKIEIDDHTSGTVQIGQTSPDHTLEVDGTITVGGQDQEEIEKLRELSGKQLEKVRKLKDHIIDYLSENNIGYSRTKQWKSDLETIEKMRRELENPTGDGKIHFQPVVPRILDPDEMRKLNDIYERWS